MIHLQNACMHSRKTHVLLLNTSFANLTLLKYWLSWGTQAGQLLPKTSAGGMHQLSCWNLQPGCIQHGHELRILLFWLGEMPVRCWMVCRNVCLSPKSPSIWSVCNYPDITHWLLSSVEGQSSRDSMLDIHIYAKHVRPIYTWKHQRTVSINNILLKYAYRLKPKVQHHITKFTTSRLRP